MHLLCPKRFFYGKKIGFIGPGRVGKSLSDYFQSKGLTVVGLASKNDTYIEVIRQATLLFITTQDRYISSAMDKLYAELDKSVEDMSDTIILHCSGALSSNELGRAKKTMVLMLLPSTLLWHLMAMTMILILWKKHLSLWKPT